MSAKTNIWGLKTGTTKLAVGQNVADRLGLLVNHGKVDGIDILTMSGTDTTGRGKSLTVTAYIDLICAFKSKHTVKVALESRRRQNWR
jgi:hypothetical protein